MSERKPSATGKQTPSKTGGSGNRPAAASEPVPTRRRADRYTAKPEFWDNIMSVVPPWADEVAAILLIVFGVVSFLSLLNVSGDETISAAWSKALIDLFGYGSAIVSAGLFGLGVILLLPRAGIVIRFPARRILAIELSFFTALALLHLLSGGAELRSLARLGRGGGQVGWALSSVVSGVVGIPVAIVVFSILFAIGCAVVIGVRRKHVKSVLDASSRYLHRQSLRLNPPKAAPVARASRLDEALAKPMTFATSTGAPALAMPTAAQVQRVRTFNITRIRVDETLLPPSQRAALLQPSPPPSAEDQLLNTREKRDVPTAFNAIGEVKGKPTKGSTFVPVERPDGRMKRYFVVSSMREARTSVKREPGLPPLDLLHDVPLNLPDEREINNNVVLIENTLLEFDIDVDVADVKVGPTVTQYAVQPYRENKSDDGESRFSRTRVSKIASLSSDLALALSARRLRLETPIPGTNFIGIEVPNRKPSVVALRSVIESRAFQEEAAKRTSPLFVPLGRDVSGAPIGIDLAQMPHLLIAGTTGSGKSVCIAALVAALILENRPEQVRMVMLDPKMVELSRFNGIPHLLGPVETDQERMIEVLRWCTREMDRRYKLLEEHAARNIDTFNARLGRRNRDQALPYIVILIDEIGDLMLSRPDETEKTLTRLAQMARAVGMHLIVATQRPSVDIITGLIKANFPSRISFAVASGTDSRVILDSVGAENLMGRGDMLYQSASDMAPRRVQSCFISDDEVRALTQFWRDQVESNEGQRQVSPWERGLTRREFLAETDPLLEQAISLVIAEQEASASQIQRKLGLGYPRAARIMELLQELGIVGELKADRRSREVLIRPGEDPFKDLIEKRMRAASQDSDP